MKPILLLLALVSLSGHNILSSLTCNWQGTITAYAVITNSNTGVTDSTEIIINSFDSFNNNPYVLIDTLFLNNGDSFKISINAVMQGEPPRNEIYLENGKLIDSVFMDYGGTCPAYREYKLYRPQYNQLQFSFESGDSVHVIPIIRRVPTAVPVILNKKSIVVNDKIISESMLAKDESIQSVAIYDVSGRECKINSALNNIDDFLINANLPHDNICILRVITDREAYSYKFFNN